MRTFLLIGFLGLLLMACGTGSALEPDAQLSQIGHTAWRIRDGAFSGAVNVVTQTADGYLWIGTDNGLLRYDGVRFLSVESGQILAMERAADDGLWFGTGQSIFHMDHGHVDRIEGPRAHVNVIRQDTHGTVWFTRSRIATGDSGALCQVIGKKMHCLTGSEGVDLPYAEALAVGANGDLWVASGNLLLRGRPGAFQQFPHSELSAAATSDGIQALAPCTDGSILVGITRTGPGLGLQRLSGVTWKDAYSSPVPSSKLSVTATLIDRDGAVWIGTADKGVFRVRKNGFDHFAEANGLSGNAVSNLYEDREGNIWVGTKKGLDQFRSIFVKTFSTSEGLGGDSVNSVTASAAGGVWIGNKGSLSLLRYGKVTNYSPANGLPGQRVTALLEDQEQRLWVGIDADLYRFTGGHFERILDSEAHPSGVVVSIVEDTEHKIWILATRQSYTLLRFEPASNSLRAEVLPIRPAGIAADPDGGLFISSGHWEQPLGLYQRGTVENWVPQTILPRNAFAFSRDGAKWAGTPRGIEYFNRQNSRFIDKTKGLPCDQIFSMVFDQSEDLWAYASCGLISISKEELSRFASDPGYSIKSRLFDVFDGALPESADFTPSATRSTDGRLWFANGTDLQVVDPSHPEVIAPPAAVQIEAIVARHVEHSAVQGMTLPALTQDVDLRYTAPELGIPERLRFRYRLDGHDKEWQDVTKLREAFYTDLRPGTYTFRVVTSDAAGVSNGREAALTFTILPAWYQTKTFIAAVLTLSLIAIILGYRLRIREVRREAQARYDERLAERTRIARDIHDTLLQTIQGSKMLADTALSQLSEQDQVQARVQMLSTWLGNAMEEGRTALRSLRAPVIEKQSLESLLQDALDDCALSSKIVTRLQVEGEPVPMSVCVREEIYRIGYEAINNACVHSRAPHLSVVLTYASAFEMRVKDDGAGVDPKVIEQGRSGHFGLAGMRERARFLRANLAFKASPGKGTEVILSVPLSGLLEDARPSMWARIVRLMRG